MTEKTIKEPMTVAEDPSPLADQGTGFLFWGLVSVVVLNLVMVIGALALFAP